jgi:hypothetical protein
MHRPGAAKSPSHLPAGVKVLMATTNTEFILMPTARIILKHGV